MGKIAIVWSIFLKEKYTRLYMLLFVVLVTIVSNISFSLLREEYILKKICEQSNFENAFYFSKATSIPVESMSMFNEKIEEQLTIAGKNGSFVGKIDYIYTYVEDVEENMMIMNYNDVAIDHIELPLSAGSWISKDEKNEAVISYKFKAKYDVGDEVIVLLDDKQITLHIVGFLEKKDYVVNFTSSGYVDLSLLIGPEENAIITNTLYDENGKKVQLQGNQGVLIYPAENEAKRLVETLSRFGSICGMEEIASNYEQTVRNRLYNLIGINIILLLLCMSGIGAMNFISLYNCKREYGIYFLCGLKKKDIIYITIGINTIILVIGAFVGNLFCIVSTEMFPIYNVENLLITLIMIIIIMMISTVLFYNVIKKENIVDLTRR